MITIEKLVKFIHLHYIEAYVDQNGRLMVKEEGTRLEGDVSVPYSEWREVAPTLKAVRDQLGY